MKTLMVIAGEASGDLHGGEILRELRTIATLTCTPDIFCKTAEPPLRIIGVGGIHMTPHLDLKVADLSELGVVGLVEPLVKLPKLLGLRRNLIKIAKQEKITDLLTLDYPGFNFSLARKLKASIPGLRLHHYVCPQVWAWKESRIPKLGHLLDTLYCLFDFEPPLFKGLPVDARFFGNPLVEVVKPEMDQNRFLELTGLTNLMPIVALLPGSRMGEVQRLLPPMVELVNQWDQDPSKPPVQWVLPMAPTLKAEKIRPLVLNAPLKIVEGCSYSARAFASAALVCSGTATLETALLGTPFAILYRMNPITLTLARHLVKVPWFGLANVVAQKAIATELLQNEVNPSRLAEELSRLLDPATANPMRSELLKIKEKLGTTGAAHRVAEDLFHKILAE